MFAGQVNMIPYEKPRVGEAKANNGAKSWKLLLIAVLSLSISGCESCRRSKDLPDIDDKEKKKVALTLGDMRPLPHGTDVSRNLVKPGHLAEAQQAVKAGLEDLKARIETRTIDNSGNALPIPGSRTSVTFERPASMPKGQSKVIDIQFFVGPVPPAKSENAPKPATIVSSNLVSAELGTILLPKQTPTTAMPGNQYFFTVLSGKPAEYEFLNKLDLLAWPDSSLLEGESIVSYSLVLCDGRKGRWALPSSFFGWTSTAYLLWDDVDPETLTSNQQQAMIDWLHWGGQIIISGPQSWDRLRNSFLGKYLPLTEASTTTFGEEQRQTLIQNWALREGKIRRAKKIEIAPSPVPLQMRSPNDPNFAFSDLSGDPLNNEWFVLDGDMKEEKIGLLPLPSRTLPRLDGKLTEDASWLNKAEGIACEKRVGRGRIVMTTFSMADPYFARWNGYSSFLNATALRRPSRQWLVSGGAFDSPSDRLVWSDMAGLESDSRLATGVRILSRDAASTSIVNNSERSNVGGTSEESDGATATDFNVDSSEPRIPALAGWEGDLQNGVASWNSHSAVSDAAKQILQQSSGIDVPQIGTIVKLLLGYLAVLVPLNWFVFYLLRRLEWAWVAVPFIAGIGAVVIATAAQLDIGFAQSYTELAVVELQSDYPRAHVSRFSAIYSSLSTPYELRLKEQSGISVPMLSDSVYDRLGANDLEQIRYETGADEIDRIWPFQVRSNTIRLLQTEQMLDLEGGIAIRDRSPLKDRNAEIEIENRTSLNLKSAVAVRKLEDGTFEAAIVGDCDSTETVSVKFSGSAWDELKRFWNEDPETSVELVEAEKARASKLIQGGLLLPILAAVDHLTPGECRLVAWNKEPVSGFEALPATSTTTHRTAVVCTLKVPKSPDPIPDLTLKPRRIRSSRQSAEIEDAINEAEKEPTTEEQPENQ